MPVLPLWTCTQQQILEEKAPSEKTAFPLLFLKQPVLLQPHNLHSFLHLTAGQAIRPLPTTAARVLLSIPPPFLSPGDIASGPSTLLQQGAAHFHRNLLSKHSKGPNQHITAGSSSSVHQVTAKHGILGATSPS